MTTHRVPVRSLTLAYVVLLAANVGGALLLLPIWVQLLANTVACVYIGCLLSTRLPSAENGELLSFSKQLNEDESVISMSDAKQFPLVASAFLFGFYLLFKVLPKEVFVGLVNAYFSITTVLSVSGIFADMLPFSEEMGRVLYSWSIPGVLQKVLEIKKMDFSKARVVCIIVAALPVGFYFATRHWALNNIFAILFSLVALKSLSLSSTKTGLLLLWALFFYDIFWVYGTDVMVTVAKNLDVPIKILFPYLSGDGEVKNSMVGLGDIVIPGIFVSLCLKFDIEQAFLSNPKVRRVADIDLPYFSMCCAGYIYGIIETFLAMFIFDHPQPALLFLVPMCTLPVLLRALARGQLALFFNYDTDLQLHPSQQDPAKEE